MQVVPPRTDPLKHDPGKTPPSAAQPAADRNSPALTFACPKCKTALKTAPGSEGAKVVCPKCGQKLRVPAPPENPTLLGELLAPGTLAKPGPGPTPGSAAAVAGSGYRLVEKIGSGTFGDLWKAQAPGGADVAVKIISRPVDQREVQQELQALELIKGLNHPCLIRTHDFWIADNRLHIAMDLAEGSLTHFMEQCRARGLPGIPITDLLRYMSDAADGLDYLHSEKVHHRDIKPANILLRQGRARLADFGLARAMRADVTTEATAAGTPMYMAPEVWSHQVSPRSDQWSLAATYADLRLQSLTGDPDKRLFQSADIVGLMREICAGPPDLSGLEKPEQVVLQRALAATPSDRYPTCKEFATALQDALLLPPQAQPKDRPPTAPSGPNWFARGAIGVVLVGVLAAGITILAPLIAPMVAQPPDQPNQPDLLKEWGKEVKNSIGMTLVHIPPGKFQMGSPADEEARGAEEKQHNVKISREFWLGVHEVTQGQFQKVMNYNSSYFSPDGMGKPGVKYPNPPAGGRNKAPADTSAFPVENVSWDEAVEFCKKLSATAAEEKAGRAYRLPTEAEWEYACRGGVTSYQVFHTGEFLQANFDGNSPYGGAEKSGCLARTAEVGSYKPNGFGLWDMHGNVWEWCADWYGKHYYNKSPLEDPQGPTGGEYRVIRGGAWFNGGRVCRSAYRTGKPPAFCGSHVGFRVALVPSD